MALELGANHAVSGTGSTAIARPLGLVATVTYPAWVAADPGTPSELRTLGHVAVGNDLGDLPAVALVHSPQLIYPLADELTVLSWTLRPGVAAVVQEIVRPEDGGMPVQRNPSLLVLDDVFDANNSTEHDHWYYSPPGQRVLEVHSLVLERSQVDAFTSFGGAFLTVANTIGTVLWACNMAGENSPSFDRLVITPSGLVLRPGDDLYARSLYLHDGGSAQFRATLVGTELDA